MKKKILKKKVVIKSIIINWFKLTKIIINEWNEEKIELNTSKRRAMCEELTQHSLTAAVLIESKTDDAFDWLKRLSLSTVSLSL